MSDICETILIKSNSKAGQVDINVSDFDPKVHEPVGGSGYVAPADDVDDGDNAPLGTDSGDQFSDEQLRDVIETITGTKPHHKTGRAKLVDQYNELNEATDATGEE